MVIVTMVIVDSSPKDRVGLDPFQMAELHGLYMGVTNYLLTGMILQVGQKNRIYYCYTAKAPEKRWVVVTSFCLGKGYFQGRTVIFREGMGGYFYNPSK